MGVPKTRMRVSTVEQGLTSTCGDTVPVSTIRAWLPVHIKMTDNKARMLETSS